MSDTATEAEGRYSIDEMSALTGMPSRRIRFYQSEGVLPPPAREGRQAVYNDDHLRRLRLIAELHDNGLRLAAIAEIVEQAEAIDPSLRRIFDLKSSLRAPWVVEGPCSLTKDELFERIGERSEAKVDELVEFGFCEVQPDGTYFVRLPKMMDVSLRFEKAGVDLATLARAGRILETGMRELAEQVLALFLDRLGEGFTEHGTPIEVAAALEVMRPAATTVAGIYFTNGIEQALARYVEAQRATPPSGE